MICNVNHPLLDFFRTVVSYFAGLLEVRHQVGCACKLVTASKYSGMGTCANIGGMTSFYLLATLRFFQNVLFIVVSLVNVLFVASFRKMS